MFDYEYVEDPNRVFSDKLLANVKRASMDTICDKCGKKYIDHYKHKDYPTFRLICGDIIFLAKL